MTTVAWIILIVAVAAIALAGVMAWKVRRTKELRSKFGPEYEHVLQVRGSAGAAEKELEQRAKRVEQFHIRPLTQAEGNRFAGEWHAAQERFVDDPRLAVAEADKLVHEAMKARGYPISTAFEDRAADLSVEHPVVVEHYRAAHAIALRDERTPVSTEDLRTAMVHYRALFEDLLNRRITEEVRR